MFVVAQDLVGASRVENGQGGILILESLETRLESVTAARAGEPFAERFTNGLSERFAGGRSQVAGELIGFWVLDAQGHVHLYITKGISL